ncbi:MAG TPA: ATP-binding protein [Gaiellaceae bacterium]|nr:ATP-binding protein [Gaiellaceae bacterium]
MHQAIQILSGFSSVLFVILAAVAVFQWLRRRALAAGWLALTFASLGLLVIAGLIVPSPPHSTAAKIGARFVIELLVLFPYLLYRFATAFRPPSRRLTLIVASFTVGLTIWTFALPHLPNKGEKWSSLFLAYAVVFVVHWALLSIVVSTRLWRAGAGQPSVASNRMRMLAFAAATLTLAIVALVGASSSDVFALASQVLGVMSGVAFLFGLAPPALVKANWRTSAQREIQNAIRELMTLATTREEIAARVLPSIAAIVGASAAAVVDSDGRTLARQGIADGLPLHVDSPGATLLMWTSPYAPFFGDDELRLLETLAALVGVALDRVRLFEQEREARIGLERANEVMANFVALAAHELRTPVTAIHGFVQTLNHLGARLSDEQRVEVRAALEQQTARLAQLVEQLLDLSRLDASAVEVRRQTVELRPQLEQTVRSAAQAYDSVVELEVDGPHEALVDPNVLDRIVTNLVTNAFRYGEPPVTVAVHQDNGTVSISVEDSGKGVAPELEDTLFERFTRAGVARDRVAGTGLGLAIARAYAHAHHGDLRYERGQRGARFVIELPSI